MICCKEIFNAAVLAVAINKDDAFWDVAVVKQKDDAMDLVLLLLVLQLPVAVSLVLAASAGASFAATIAVAAPDQIAIRVISESV